ncbi:Fumarylacetoacetate (FAA) hydrolase family [Zea mays]|uniref:Fumarylacetoacetate (FAA) hydrolase family n=1 Tax=Zea mays TaxID=4577 RepID=A0A1D6HU94_MAIZE|nr:Fumarylacetoacetate (FAA) hydrolase family [Zea mays]
MREEPILFLKPTSSFLHAGVATVAVEIPEPLKSLHHKAELVVVISWRGRDVPEASAMDFVRGNREPTQDNLRLPEIKGKFDPSKAAALGLRPGPKYRELQVGNSIQSDQFDEMIAIPVVPTVRVVITFTKFVPLIEPEEFFTID